MPTEVIMNIQSFPLIRYALVLCWRNSPLKVRMRLSEILPLYHSAQPPEARMQRTNEGQLINYP